ncbi:hypothetical protein E4U14_008523 [Claviceps sp. LM454 group G7]|nr:hypothetical protein E4U14_008523 [Claviceps sp. LM454 group G7]
MPWGFKSQAPGACAVTHAKQVISRQPSLRPATRPFERVHWDLQDYPESYNGMSWLIVLKDEFSGLLHVYSLPNKSHDTVFNVLVYYDSWAKKRYGLSVVKFRQDNERAVISESGLTRFQLWALKEGIEPNWSVLRHIRMNPMVRRKERTS